LICPKINTHRHLIYKWPGGGAPQVGPGFYLTHPITPNQSTITWRMYYYAGGTRIAMRVANMPVSQPQPTPTPQPYPAPTPTQSTYQENIFTHFVAFLKDLFGAQPVYAAVSQAPTAVIVPIGKVYFLLSDHLGSTTITLNLDGSIKSEIRYDAWGETRYNSGTTPTERHYTGQIEESGFGLYFYNARWYDSSLSRFIQADTIIPQPGSPQGWDRYAYTNNNPVKYSDPSGHCPICIVAALVIGVIVLTGDTPKATPPPPPSNANASTFGDLLQLGIGHATSANIVGEGLQDLQNDPSVKGAQDDILEKIRSDPNYEKQPFEVPISEPEDFTANGPDGNWVTGALTGNPSFWMVHTATLYATNAKVSADGTITATWKVDDQFDYIPDWKGRSAELKSDPVRYFAYNGFAQFIAPLYHGLLQAPPYRTNAYWDQTHPPE